jgi:hypothetical protein
VENDTAMPVSEIGILGIQNIIPQFFCQNYGDSTVVITIPNTKFYGIPFGDIAG